MKYALVRILDEDTPLWDDYSAMYVQQAQVSLARRSVSCNIVPVIRSFAAYGAKIKIGEVTPAIILKWVASISNLAPGSIRTKIGILHAIFGYAVKNGILNANPVRGIKKPRAQFKGRALRDDELVMALRFLPADIVKAALFSLYCGVRIGEILILDWAWVDGDRIVIPDYLAKGRLQRIIFFHPKARKIMGERGKGNLFNLCHSRVRFWIRKCWKDLGMAPFRFHDFRHTFATRFLEISGDTKALMEQGGWANEVSLRPYQHITEVRRRATASVSYDL